MIWLVYTLFVDSPYSCTCISMWFPTSPAQLHVRNADCLETMYGPPITEGCVAPILFSARALVSSRFQRALRSLCSVTFSITKYFAFFTKTYLNWGSTSVCPFLQLIPSIFLFVHIYLPILYDYISISI